MMRLRRNKQQFMNILYGPKIKVQLRQPADEFFNIIPINHPLVKNKIKSHRNVYRRNVYTLLFDPRNPMNVQNFYKIYARVKNEPIVRNPFREHEPFMRRAGTISNAAKKVQSAVRKHRVHQKTRARSATKIQRHWRYSPGGPGFRSAMAHFKSLQN